MSKSFESPNLETKSVEELTMQLLDTNAKLNALQKEREMMLANISHDLRAPITAIRSAVDLAHSDPEMAPAELQKLLALIDRRTKTLEDLINDMYYLFCVEDPSRPMTTTELDACTFLEEYFYDAIIDSRYDRFDMQLDVPEDLKCTIDIDPQKMARVLDNLMTNCAKYAGDKATFIKLGAKIADTLNNEDEKNPDSPNRRYLIISVSDDGCGIAEEFLPRIFSRTFTVSDSRTPGTASGSGLGLSIAKAIVERHGGTIGVTSELESGTEFTIKLPCRA